MLPLSDPERELALSYALPERRAALRALWTLDERLGQLVARNREPLICEMRVLWWSEALERLGRERPAEPLLEALAEHVLPLGIGGGELAAMADGWRALLIEPFGDAEMNTFASERGRRLFALSERLLAGHEDWGAANVGADWAFADLVRKTADHGEAARALDMARNLSRGDRRRWPRELRALGALAMLARADALSPPEKLKEKGAPSRVARMSWHRLTGK